LELQKLKANENFKIHFLLVLFAGKIVVAQQYLELAIFPGN
jgi:hypothetical protein